MKKYLDLDGLKYYNQILNNNLKNEFISVSDKGKTNGIASLDENGNVPLSQLGNVDNVLFEIVHTLPTELTETQKNHIFVVPKDVNTESNKNAYKEYIYTGEDLSHIVQDYWEELGEFTADINLEDYSKKSETTSPSSFGFKIINESGELALGYTDVIGKEFQVKVPKVNSDNNNDGLMTALDKVKLDQINVESLIASINAANDTANHPTYIGEDNYVYAWDKDSKSYVKSNIYVKGDKGDKGDNGMSPKIIEGNWWLYDDARGDYYNSGVSVSSAYELTKANVEKVLTGNITTHTHDQYAIASDLASEADRAKAAEKTLRDIINVINGSSDVDGSFRKIIADLIGGAPESLDTLKEIADKLANDDTLHNAIQSAITLKADKTALDSAINRITSLEGSSASIIEVSGAGNAVTSISKSGTKIIVNKGMTFLTSHQSLVGYATETWVKGLKYVTDDDVAAKYQFKGNYLTSHQSLAEYIKTADADNKYLGKTEKAVSANSADNAAMVNNHTVNTDVPSNAKFTDTEYVIPTLSSAPTSSTLTFTDNGVTRSFKVGYMCRVADSSAEHGYKFYQLYNISGTNAVWGEIAGGGGDYNETVTVTLKSTVSSSDSKLIGAVVTVKNTMTNETQTQTWKGTPLVFKIPALNTYTVSASSVSGYFTPVELSYTAGIGTSRAVAMAYKYIPVGIYIYDTDGNFTKADDWNTANNGKAVGVYVGTENSKFVIAPTFDETQIQWGGYGTTISGIVTTTDTTKAKKDYAGEANTDKIIAKLGTGNAPAAEYCRNYTFKNGKKGYLWSLGEAQDAYNNKAAIDAAMRKIGGTAITTERFHWTSTQYSSDNAWILNWYNGRVNYYSKVNNYYVRAVCAL